VLAYLVPSELFFSSIGVIITIAVHNTISIMRLREQIARLEEWIRQRERQDEKQ